MNNESWMKKFNSWKPNESKKYKHIDYKKKCDNFKTGNNNLCEHYMGCPILNRTCSEECDL